MLRIAANRRKEITKDMLPRLAIIFLMYASSVAAQDVRTLSGRHLTLQTDVPRSAEIDALPQLFDQAFESWCKYFSIDPAKHADWHIQGVLLRGPESKQRFEILGLIPPGLWDFKSGYSQGKNLWLYDQTSDYYRRHLLLHEGVHCFMNTLLGGAGPPWYAEGMAELLATHKFDEGKLTINYFPRDRAEVPKFGRIEMVRNAIQEGRSLSLPQITHYGATAHRENEPYGWCWAAAAFLDGHPRYRERFRELLRHVAEPDFAKAFSDRFRPDYATLSEDWQAYLASLDYGYDFVRMPHEISPGSPLTQGSKTVEVAADRGWQSTGIELQAGKKYQLIAQGQIQVAQEPKPWISEAGGVTIRYVQGHPLGMLLGLVRPADFSAERDKNLYASPLPLGLQATISPQQSGTLYLRINDAAGSLSDNSGSYQVTVKAVTD